MNISLNLEEGSTSCAVDFEQNDIDNMWNYLMQDRDNFEYTIIQYLNNNFGCFKEDWAGNSDLQKLYENLKLIY